MTGSEWDITKGTEPQWASDFAPQQSKRRLRGWDRAPVTAHATRLHGKAVWKKQEVRPVIPKYDENDAQLELDKEGLGARKKARKAGTKENISSAIWMENKDMVDDTEVKTILAPNARRANLDIKDTAQLMASIPQAKNSTFDLPDALPRKRYNNRAIVTPKKAVQAHTHKVETVITTPPQDLGASTKRPKKTMRRSTRQSILPLQNDQNSDTHIPHIMNETTAFDYTMDVPCALPAHLPEIVTPRRSQRIGRFGSHVKKHGSRSPCKRAAIDALLMSDGDMPPTLEKAKSLELGQQFDASPVKLIPELLRETYDTVTQAIPVMESTSADIVESISTSQNNILDLQQTPPVYTESDPEKLIEENEDALFETMGCTPSKILATAASSAADKLSSPSRHHAEKTANHEAPDATSESDADAQVDTKFLEQIHRNDDTNDASAELADVTEAVENATEEVLPTFNDAPLSLHDGSTSLEEALSHSNVMEDAATMTNTSETKMECGNETLDLDETQSSPSQQLHLELSMSPSKISAQGNELSLPEVALENTDGDGERDSLSLLGDIPKLSYDPSEDHDEIYLASFLSRVKEAKKTGSKRKPSLPPHSPLKIPLESTGLEDLPSSPINSVVADVLEPLNGPERRTLGTGLTTSGSPSKRRRTTVASASAPDHTPRRSERTRLPLKSGIPLARPLPAATTILAKLDPEGPLAVQRNREKDLAAQTRVNTQRNKGASVLPEEHYVLKASNTIEASSSQPYDLETVGNTKGGLRQKTLGEYKPKKIGRGLRLKWADELVEIREFKKGVSIPEKPMAPKVEVAVTTGSQAVEKKMNETVALKEEESLKKRTTRPSRIAKFQSSIGTPTRKAMLQTKNSKGGK